MDDFELELKKDFIEEAVDLLENVEEAFLRLEVERDNSDLIDEIFRLAHNLKGTSKAVGFDQLSELTHIAENLILKLKEKELAISDKIVSCLLNFKDNINLMLEGLNSDIEKTFDVSEITNEIESILSEEANTNDSSSELTSNLDEDHDIENNQDIEVNSIDETLKTDSLNSTIENVNNEDREAFVDIEESFDQEVEAEPKVFPDAIYECPGAPIEIDQINGFMEERNQNDVSVDLKKINTKNDENKEDNDTKSNLKVKSPSQKADESIRVKLDRVHKLNNIVGELVIIQTVLSQRRYGFIQDDLSNKSIGQMAKLFKEVQELAMSFRMLPLKSTFQKMNRIVRDTSKILDKKVRLDLQGEETEVDKTVLEKLSDPLVHIVRNAVDHAIEMPEKRLESKKKEIGTICIRAFHEGSKLVIEVKDDGKGIDPKAIHEKAVKKGIIGKHRSNDLETLQLLFHPGFSTKEQVTEVSGRGVGLDVVKSNIEELGGEVTIHSEVGKGSTFRIVLPLTLAIIDGIVIRSDSERYVIPLAQVFEMVTIDKNKISTFTGSGRYFQLRGEVIPLFDISQKLGHLSKENDRQVIILLRGTDYTFGVAVHDVVNQQQIVIKKLGEEIRNQRGIMGSAILGDGRPAFILDLLEFFNEDLKKNMGFEELINGNQHAV